MLRLVHVADVHLDTLYAARGEAERRMLVESGERAFAGAVDLCLAEGAAALVIAGDLFDHERLSFRTEGFLRRQLERLGPAGVRVVVVAGNHDPGRGGRFARIAWPAHVTWIGEARPETVTLEAGGRTVGKVTGVGHPTDRVPDNLAALFPAPDPAVPHVAVLHALVEGAETSGRHDRYAPCGTEDLKARPYSYWALGHVHLRQEVCAGAWYPGNLQGRTTAETGAKGALLVTLPGPGAAPQVEFRPLAAVRFETLRLAGLEEVRDARALEQHVRRAFETRIEQAPGLPSHQWFLRVELEGPCPLAKEFPREFAARSAVEHDLEEELGAALGVESVELVAARLRPPVDLERQRGQPHVLGEALRLLEELRKGAPLPPELEDAAFAHPDSAGARRAALLEGAGEELLARLLAEQS